MRELITSILRDTYDRGSNAQSLNLIDDLKIDGYFNACTEQIIEKVIELIISELNGYKDAIKLRLETYFTEDIRNPEIHKARWGGKLNAIENAIGIIITLGHIKEINRENNRHSSSLSLPIRNASSCKI